METGIESGISVKEAVVSKHNRWSLVLAGGEGIRLHRLTRLICGDDRPKQFCPLLGRSTLLTGSIERAQSCVPSPQVLVSLMAHHQHLFRQEPLLDPAQRLIQPLNRGTAPAILHGLLSIAECDPRAVVAILSSDHFFSDEAVLSATLDAAFSSASKLDGIIILGAKPDYPEFQYGWIETAGAPDNRNLSRVRRFHEKPSFPAANMLFRRGAFWNTFIMVGRVEAFLEMAVKAVPGLLDLLRQIPCWKGHELRIPNELYGKLPAKDFSTDILSPGPEHLRLRPLEGVVWSDLGTPERVEDTILTFGCRPEWSTKRKATRPHGNHLPLAEIAATA